MLVAEDLSSAKSSAKKKKKSAKKNSDEDAQSSFRFAYDVPLSGEATQCVSQTVLGLDSYMPDAATYAKVC